MLLDQDVHTRWVSSNRKWYEEKGYIFTKYNDKLTVKAKDLTLSSDVRVEFICDYCGETKDKQFKEYINSLNKSPIKKDCCYDCRSLKNKESNMLVYGVESTNQVPEILEKRFETNLSRYGAITPSSNAEVIEKTKNTMNERYGGHYNSTIEGKEKYRQYCLDNFGVENVFQLEETKEKTKQTNLEKYGVEHHTKSEDFQDKMKLELLDKYGVEYQVQREEVKEKSRISMYENQSVATSKNQIYLWRLLGGELNFPFKTSSIDIAFPDEKIGIEYDGSGHWLRVIHGISTPEEFAIKEKNRNYGLYRGGWKIIRIISKTDKLPCNDIIEKMMEISKNHFSEGRHWIEFNIDENIIKTSLYEKEFNFGELLSYYKICKSVEEVV